MFQKFAESGSRVGGGPPGEVPREGNLASSAVNLRRARYGRRLAWALGFAALAYLLQSVIHLVVWRAHWQPGIDALRRFHKRVRPMEMRSAGKHGKSTAAVHHTGRTSGKNYVTPVWAHRVGERFLIGLPYGTSVDWCRNVVAADGCVLEYDGVRFDVIDPVIVPAAEALSNLAGSRRSMLEVMGIEFFLRLDIAPTTNGSDAARAAGAVPAQGDPLSAVAGR